MPAISGTYVLGPQTAQLTVLTGTSGPAARVGHDLEIVVDRWDATVELDGRGPRSKVSLNADGGSLRVLSRLTRVPDRDIAAIKKAIDEKVLKRSEVRFESSSLTTVDAHRVRVDGTLTLLGTARRLEFEVAITADGTLDAQASFKQSDWGIKPYGVMAGALKVADEVTVTLAGRLPEPS